MGTGHAKGASAPFRTSLKGLRRRHVTKSRLSRITHGVIADTLSHFTIFYSWYLLYIDSIFTGSNSTAWAGLTAGK